MSARPTAHDGDEFRDGVQVNLSPEGIKALATAIVEAQRPDDALLDYEAASALLGVPATWVKTEARAERIPNIKLGRYTRFDRDELIAWRDARSSGPKVRTGKRPVPRDGEGQ